MTPEERNKQRRIDYQVVFATETGERVLFDLMSFCNFTKPVIVPGDPHLTAYNDGMRRVFLRIISLMDKTDQQIARLQQEALDG